MKISSVINKTSFILMCSYHTRMDQLLIWYIIIDKQKTAIRSKKKKKKNNELWGKFNRKVPNHMAKSNDKTHQTNGQQLSYFWLGTGIFNVNVSLLRQSHQIPLYLQRCVNKTNIINKIVKIWVQQSSLCYNLKTNNFSRKHKSIY